MDLKEFLSYKNLRREEIERIIREEELAKLHALDTSDTSFLHVWEDVAEESDRLRQVREILKNKLEGKILVDLGYGEYAEHTACDLVFPLGASIYIGVDKFNKFMFLGHNPGGLDPTKNLLDQEEQEMMLEDYPRFKDRKILIVKADMLEFLSMMPSNSANFMINGIDSFVLRTNEYNEAVATEMVRATEKEGVIFGTESEPLLLIKEMKSIKEIESSEIGRYGSIFVKSI